MHKKILVFLILIFILSCLIFMYSFLKKRSQACIDKNCFNIEIAKTEQERMEGLMGRKNLAEDAGMLFIFDKEGFYPFWMKDTLIPLDIIWIDENNKIVYIAGNAQPCVQNCKNYDPPKEAKYVLEINGGLADKLNIKIGDTVNLPKKY